MSDGFDNFDTSNVELRTDAAVGGSWSSHGEVRDFAVDVSPSAAWRSPVRPPIDEALRRGGYEVRFTTPDHREDAGLRIYERYTGIHGQERLGLVDELGTVWHYDSAEVGWVAELPSDHQLPIDDLPAAARLRPHLHLDLSGWAR